MLKPLISIILVTRNACHTVEQALTSVVNQPYQNRELIIIDGGSTDGTLEVIRRFESAISFWASEPDEGIYDAMNKGIRAATGDWLYFLGADDILVYGLHRIAAYLRNTNTVYYGMAYLPTKNKVLGGHYSARELAMCNLCHQTIFYPRAVFGTMKFDTRYKILADYALNIQLWGDKRFRFRYIPELVAIYSTAGISNTEEDKLFHRDKPALVAKYLSRDIAAQRRRTKWRGAAKRVFDARGKLRGMLK